MSNACAEESELSKSFKNLEVNIKSLVNNCLLLNDFVKEQTVSSKTQEMLNKASLESKSCNLLDRIKKVHKINANLIRIEVRYRELLKAFNLALKQDDLSCFEPECLPSLDD